MFTYQNFVCASFVETRYTLRPSYPLLLIVFVLSEEEYKL